MADRTVKVRLEANVGQYSSSVNRAAQDTDKLNRKADEFDGRKITARAELDDRTANGRLRRLNGELDALDARTATPTAELKIAKFRTEAAKIGAELRELSAMDATPEVVLRVDEQSARLAVLREELRRFDGRTFRADAVVNTGNSARDVSVLASSVAALGPAAIGAGLAGTAAIAGLTSSVSVFATGAGIGMLAFKGLGDAISAAGEYAINPTAENLKKMQVAQEGMTASTQSFTRYVGSLKPVLTDLQNTARNGLLPGAEAGLRSMVGILPEVQHLTSQYSEALGELARRGGEALNDPYWRNYINFLASEAKPQILSFGQILGNFAKGFTGVQMAFKPFTDDIIRGLRSVSAEFATWGASLGGNGGFQEFLNYVREVGPQVVSAVSAIARGIGALITAGAPLAPFVLSMVEHLGNFVDVVASIPGVGTTLIGLAGALGTLNVALKASRAIGATGAVTWLAGLGKAASGAQGPVRGVATAAASSGVAVGAFGGKTQQASGKMAAFGRGLGVAARSLPIVGTALLAGAAAYSSFITSVDDAAGSVISGRQSLDEMGHSISWQTTYIEKLRAMYGDWTADMVGHLVPGIRQVGSEMASQIGKMSTLEANQSLLTMVQKDYTNAVRDFGPHSAQAADALSRVDNMTRNVAAAEIMAKYHIDSATAATIANAQAETRRVQALAEAKTAQGAYNDAVREHGATSIEALSASTSLMESQLAAGEAARQSAGGQRAYVDAIKQMVDASRGNLTPALYGMVAGLDMTGVSALGAKVKINGIGQAVATLPNGKEVILTADGKNAQVQLEAVTTSVNRIPAGRTVNVGAVGDRAQQVLSQIGFQVERLPDGTVNVTAKDDAARARLTAFVLYSNALKANPQIGANPQLAYGTMLRFINDANAQVGLPQLQANTAPADAAVNAAITQYNGMTGTSTLDANTAPATGAALRWNAMTNSMEPVPNVNANTGPANGQSSNWNAFTQGLAPRPDVNANTGPATGATSNWNAFTQGQRPTPNVNANTVSAFSAVRDFVGWVGRQVASIVVHAATGFSSGGIAMAHGGVVQDGRVHPPVIPNDDGNALSPYGRSYNGKKLRNMSGGGARMVAPNSWRVVGDRMDVPELYAPLDGSGRSLSLIAQGAATFGKALVDSSAIYGATPADRIRSLGAVERNPYAGVQSVSRSELRAMASAGGGDRSIVNTVNVSNPIAERASDSVQRELSTLATLGLFGD